MHGSNALARLSQNTWVLGLLVAGVLGAWGPRAEAQGGAGAVAGVVIETIGGLSSWLEKNSDDCAVACAGAAWGQDCSLAKDECTDTGWWEATCVAESENGCGRGRGRATATESLFGMWWGYTTDPEVFAIAKSLHGPQDKHGASGWAKAQVDGTSRATTAETPPSRPTEESSNGLIASSPGRTATEEVITWPEGTVLAVAFLDSLRLSTRAGAPVGSWMRARFDVSDVFSWETYVHLDGSGAVTATGGIPSSSYGVDFDPGDGTWNLTLAEFRVEFAVDTLETAFAGDSLDVAVHLEIELMASDANSTGPPPVPVPVTPTDLRTSTPDGIPMFDGVYVQVMTPMVAIAESAPFGPFLDTNVSEGDVGVGILDLVAPADWQAGDQVLLQGYVTHHEGRTLLTGIQSNLVGTGAPVPPTMPLPIAAILNNAEQLEGRRLRVSDCSLLDPSQWPSSPKDIAVVRVQDPSGAQIDLELLAPPEVAQGFAPIGPFHATGVLLQKDPDGVPLDSGYRIRLELIEETVPADVSETSVRAWPELAAQPNPALAGTEVVFQLPSSARVELRVLDAQGRRIRNLVSRELAGGVHSAGWDLDDDDGARVPSGIYFLHLSADGFRQTRKITVAR